MQTLMRSKEIELAVGMIRASRCLATTEKRELIRKLASASAGFSVGLIGETELKTEINKAVSKLAVREMNGLAKKNYSGKRFKMVLKRAAAQMSMSNG
ncbi:hypothetical protein EON81_04280 [bacterium]|nr:MAG: hypothetical protein EON81_04280 [bacterium]